MRIRTALAVSATLALTAVGCGQETTPTSSEATDPAASSTTADAEPSAEPTDEPSAAPSPDESDAPAGETSTIPVYFVGRTSQGARLYREFRQVTTDNPLLAGARLLTTGDVLDPDYDTLLPDAPIDDIVLDPAAHTITVALSDPALTQRPEGLNDAEAEIAAQSLVYTLQGIAGTRDPVVVTLDGQPSTLAGIDTAGGLAEAPEIDVRAMVNITAPEEGATVSGKFKAEGVANSFEATVPWEIRRGSKVVRTGFSTAEGWMDKLYPWKTTVSVKGLAPGEYVFAIMTDDPSGGAEGSAPMADTKTITIE